MQLYSEKKNISVNPFKWWCKFACTEKLTSNKMDLCNGCGSGSLILRDSC